MRSVFHCATVTTLKATIRDSLSFVHYHLNSGIDHMYLFFDDPEDEAIPHLRDNKHLECFRCDKEYWNRQGINPDSPIQVKQKINATFAFKLARKAKFDWLIHLDSDELLFSDDHLKKSFYDISREIDVVRFPVLEAWPQEISYDHPFWQISLFKVHPGRHFKYKNFAIDPRHKKKHRKKVRSWNRRKRLYQLLRGNFNDIGNNFLMGHTHGKAATRTTADIQQIGNHLPITREESKLNIKLSEKVFLLHFDCQGYEEWKAKWESRINGSAQFQTERFSRQRQKQMQLFEKALSENEEKLKILYNKIYNVSMLDKTLLRMVGLIKKIKLDEKLFNSPFQSSGVEHTIR